jgi:hypothetical protein
MEAEKLFQTSRPPYVMKINGMLNNPKLWDAEKGTYSINNGVLTFDATASTRRSIAYLKPYDNAAIFNFNAIFAIDTGWQAIGFRAKSYTAIPWSTQDYIFIIKKDVIELQRFNSRAKFITSLENKWIKSGEEYNIEAGAQTIDNKVKLSLKVNGEEIISVFDDEKDFMIEDEGYFVFYDFNNDKGLTIKSVK